MATIESIINKKIENLKSKLFSSSFMLKKITHGIETKYKNLFPVPLNYLELKINKKDMQYHYYLILTEQLILNNKFEKYNTSFIFNYDENSFDIKESLRELKRIILVEESLYVDDLIECILNKID